MPLPTSLVVKNGSKTWLANRLGDAAAGVADADHDGRRRRAASGRAIRPFRSVPLDDVADRVRGVDDEVQDDLVDVAAVARHQRQVAEIGLDLGDVLVFVARDDERALDRLVEIDRAISFWSGCANSFIERTMVGDAVEAVERAVERLRHVLEQVVEIGVRLGLATATASATVRAVATLQRPVLPISRTDRSSRRARSARCR